VAASLAYGQAWWHWAAQNSPAILFSIYIATTACLIGLALGVFFLARRLAEHVHNDQNQAALVARLEASLAEQALAIEALGQRLHLAEYAAGSGSAEARVSPTLPEEGLAALENLARAVDEHARAIEALNRRIDAAAGAQAANGLEPDPASGLKGEILLLIEEMAVDAADREQDLPAKGIKDRAT
jgi:hypothetical protein